MMKNKSLIISGIVGLIIGFFFAGIIGFDISNAFKGNEDVTVEGSIDKQKFGELYDLDSNHIYQPIYGPRVYELAEDKESFILYIGRSTCPYCQKVVPELMNAATNNDFDVIYHVDILDENNSLFVQQQQINAVPLVVFFKDGVAQNALPGYVQQSEIETMLSNIYK